MVTRRHPYLDRPGNIVTAVSFLGLCILVIACAWGLAGFPGL